MRAPAAPSAAVSRQSHAYRQGLVLGLTMAEVMLLLVFCLLIATAVTLKRGQDARDVLEQRLRQAELAREADKRTSELLEKNSQLREALEARAASTDPAKVDEFWRKLVESAAVVDALAEKGLSRENLLAAADDIVQAERLKREGVDLSQAARNASLVAQIGKAFSGTAPSEEKIVEAIGKGLAAREASSGHRWPPIIKLSEADGYFFESGRAELGVNFTKTLRTSVADSLLKTARDYDVDVIEVVGHTDEQPLGSRSSNLDKGLQTALSNSSGVSALRPADNAGLGLARAIAVVGVLSEDKRLAGYKILPLSGAQLIKTDETLARGDTPGDVKERRRIEIRLRKSAASSNQP
ncbi:MAG: nuclease [Ancylobacter novellus]|uniref:Nuclease n=1 Tax=Ancylobacter novellus TaxID=921 RepID=A0A2W5K8M0_ANCNO|nr:MAG: nuclease [Ancylobacter novellus]